jgi:hypothetical protein
MRRRLTPERAAELRKWTSGRAARFGYLAGVGFLPRASWPTMPSNAKILQAVLGLATHWKLSLGTGGLRIMIPMSSRDRDLLERAAAGRGVSVSSLAASLIRTVVAERLVDAVLDDA